MQKQALRKKTPPEPTIDLPGYIIYHSSRPPAEWRKDVLELKEKAGRTTSCPTGEPGS